MNIYAPPQPIRALTTKALAKVYPNGSDAHGPPDDPTPTQPTGRPRKPAPLADVLDRPGIGGQWRRRRLLNAARILSEAGLSWDRMAQEFGTRRESAERIERRVNHLADCLRLYKCEDRKRQR
jgi:hypothetical protein